MAKKSQREDSLCKWKIIRVRADIYIVTWKTKIME